MQHSTHTDRTSARPQGLNFTAFHYASVWLAAVLVAAPAAAHDIAGSDGDHTAAESKANGSFPEGFVFLLAQATAAPPAPATNQVSIAIEGDQRVIRANGLPDHPTGQFPNRGNPNRIAPQNYVFHVPAQPKTNAATTPLGMHPFGVAVNGVVFDPGAAEWWNGDPGSGWQYEPLGGGINLGVDESHAHVQPNGAYHYHGLPTGLLRQLGGGNKMVLIGWAADGFPIYGPWAFSNVMNAKSLIKPVKSGYRLKKGVRPGGPGGPYDGTFVADYEYVAGTGDLDECNGRFGVTPEFPQGAYHYFLTAEFPFVPRLYRGTPDRSFMRTGPPGGRRGRPGGPGGPPPPGRPPGPPDMPG